MSRLYIWAYVSTISNVNLKKIPKDVVIIELDVLTRMVNDIIHQLKLRFIVNDDIQMWMHHGQRK